jgi:protein TonB
MSEASEKMIAHAHDSAAESAEPLRKVLAIDPGQYTIGIVLLLAELLHVGVAVGAVTSSMLADILRWNRGMQVAIADKLTQEYEVTQEKDEPPPPPPEPEKAPPPPPPPVAKEDKVEEPPKEETPAPTPAQAAAVLTQDSKPDDVEDLTATTFVSGSGDGTSYGAVSAAGTGRSGLAAKVVRNDGAPSGTGTGPAAPPPPPPGPDRSRKAGLDGSADWNDCPFPAEADAEQIDEAFVVLQVNVGADGRPTTITVMQDPGHGFGRQAKICAQRKSFKTALDRDGNPIPGQTGKFSVHFSH